MPFCCLWRNVETSCHKHFIIVSRHQQTPPLTTSDKCHNFPRYGVAALIARDEARYLLRITISARIPPAFDAPVRGVPVGMSP